MGRGLLWVALAGSACSAQIADGPAVDASISDSDDAIDPPWGTPAKHPQASDDTIAEDDGSLSTTSLEMVFARGTATGKELYLTTRSSLADPWTPATLLPFNDPTVSDETPRFSTDGLTLYFASERAGGAGDLDIYSVTRMTIGGTWGAVQPVVGPNTAALEKWYTPCGSSYLVIVDGDIAEGTIGSPPTTSTALSDPASSETGPYLTPDCLTTYFASPRMTGTRIWMSTRTSITSPWSTPVMFTEFLAVGGAQEDPWLSPDQRLFSFCTNVDGTKDQFLVTR